MQQIAGFMQEDDPPQTRRELMLSMSDSAQTYDPALTASSTPIGKSVGFVDCRNGRIEAPHAHMKSTLTTRGSVSDRLLYRIVADSSPQVCRPSNGG